MVSVTVGLTPDEALALAQFVKRSLFDTYREFANDEEEARLILAAVDNLREGLAAESFTPPMKSPLAAPSQPPRRKRRMGSSP
jgi:hypothetical protein